MLQEIKEQGGHLQGQIGTKITNMVTDIHELLPIQFHQNPSIDCGVEMFNKLEARAAISDDGSARKTIMVESRES